jgi:hypothetical protein
LRHTQALVAVVADRVEQIADVVLGIGGKDGHGVYFNRAVEMYTRARKILGVRHIVEELRGAVKWLRFHEQPGTSRSAVRHT